MENSNNVFSENVNFLPWIGPNFEKGINGQRTMVLGESIYCCTPYSCKNPDCKNQIIEIVKKQVEVREKNRFYNKVAKLVYQGSKNLLQNKLEFWNGIAFYELIQVSVGTKPKERPTTEMWDNSKEPLFEVLKALRPQVIYITGKELTSNFLNKFESRRIHKEEKGFFECNIIYFDGNWIKTFSFYHPAYFKGFTYAIQDKLLLLVNTPIEKLS